MKYIFKYASLLMAAAMLFSCHGTIDPEGQDPEPGPGIDPTPENLELKLTSDRNLVQTNVDVATLTVTLGDEVLTEGVTFYDVDFNEMNIQNFQFKASKAGDYAIVASYGTYISEKITIKAIDIEIPATPADPQPTSVSFKTRVLLTEFTTVGCTYCPNMKLVLHELMADEEMAEKLVFTACHSGIIDPTADPAYIKTKLDEFCQSTGFPSVNFDFYYTEGNYTKPLSQFKSYVEQFHSSKEEVAAGIAVNSQVVDNKLIFKATVKAAETAEYRIGACLLEDGIYAVQKGGMAESWMNTHDDVMRYIDSKYGNNLYYGHQLGKIEKGKTTDYLFDWDLDTIWSEGDRASQLYAKTGWSPFVMENLHLVVFVSTKATDQKGNDYYYINNVIDCPINGKTPFEYR
ncbi:MAG: Omp28-related outer membrane protein [Bacteroidales bacterium]|nr:Omp28-related outer membrane protein [Bacteroidales bacterium]